jgi:TonB family protein
MKGEAVFSPEAVYGEAKAPNGQSILTAFSVGVRLTASEFKISERVRFEKLPLPSYPTAMLNIGVYGKCEIVFDLNADGSVDNVRIGSSPNLEFAEVAMPIVKNWKLEPLKERRDLKPVTITATFIFSIYSEM